MLTTVAWGRQCRATAPGAGGPGAQSEPARWRPEAPPARAPAQLGPGPGSAQRAAASARARTGGEAPAQAKASGQLSRLQPPPAATPHRSGAPPGPRAGGNSVARHSSWAGSILMWGPEMRNKRPRCVFRARAKERCLCQWVPHP